jgi:pSer/pThr/pTyr-binding forkhead associated (FHA) protein
VITCPICGKENQSYYKYCLSCGSDLSQAQSPKAAVSAVKAPGKRMCTTCSTEVPEGFLFCGKCGTRYDEAPPPVAVPVSAPSAERSIQATLVVVLPDGTEGGRHTLRPGDNVIGRKTGDLFAADVYLSPEHAVLSINRGKITLKDKTSLNGCYIKLTEEVELKHSDVFRIGQELVRFEYSHESPMLMTPKDDTKIMGSPDPGYWGRILLIIGRERIGNAFPLAEESVVLGRERADILFPDDGFVSGTHARLSSRDGRAFLVDLGSSNGTFIKLREEVNLQPHDHILLGQQLFRIEF